MVGTIRYYENNFWTGLWLILNGYIENRYGYLIILYVISDLNYIFR